MNVTISARVPKETDHLIRVFIFEREEGDPKPGMISDLINRAVLRYIAEERSMRQSIVTTNERLKSNTTMVSRLKLFMQVFNSTAGQARNDVEEKNFINQLVKTDMFSEDEAGIYIKKAIQNGQIYETKAGFYASASWNYIRF